MTTDGMPASLRRLHLDERATGATELMLLLATVVLPLVALRPIWFDMIRYYSLRLFDGIVMPFA